MPSGDTCLLKIEHDALKFSTRQPPSSFPMYVDVTACLIIMITLICRIWMRACKHLQYLIQYLLPAIYMSILWYITLLWRQLTASAINLRFICQMKNLSVDTIKKFDAENGVNIVAVGIIRNFLYEIELKRWQLILQDLHVWNINNLKSNAKRGLKTTRKRMSHNYVSFRVFQISLI